MTAPMQPQDAGAEREALAPQALAFEIELQLSRQGHVQTPPRQHISILLRNRDWRGAIAALRSPRPELPDGWVAVPRESTRAMLDAYRSGLRRLISSVTEDELLRRWKAPRKGKGYLVPEDDKCSARWAAMLAAAAAAQPPRPASGWEPIETAPRDGQIIWVWLFETGIRQVLWRSAEDIAEDEGGPPDLYQAGFYEADDLTENWSPRWWMPFDGIPLPPTPPETPDTTGGAK